MIETKCIICNGNVNYKVIYEQNLLEKQIASDIFSARRTPDNYHYRIVRCLNCGLVYSNPIFEKEKIEELYAESEQTYDSEINVIKSTYGYYFKKLTPYLLKKERLLEIGCGSGFFLEVAREFGFKEVYGVEPSAEAVSKAKNGIKEYILNTSFDVRYFEKNSFDLICCFQTLDHLILPDKFLADCRTLLKPNGIMYVITHNIEAFPAKIMGEKSPVIDVEHIYLFSKNTLKKLFLKMGFKPIVIFDVTNRYSLSYWIRMIPLNNCIKDIVLSIFNTALLSKKTLAIKAGNIAIFARKKF